MHRARSQKLLTESGNKKNQTEMKNIITEIKILRGIKSELNDTEDLEDQCAVRQRNGNHCH